jgi:hypothetical protein
MIDGHRKGIYARVANYNLTMLRTVSPAREGQVLGATEALAKRRGELIEGLPKWTRRMGGVGQAQIAGGNIDLHSLARGSVSKTCCPSATKTGADFWRGSS